MLRVALAQTNMIVGDFKGNAQNILDFVNRAREQQADVIVFPELALCGYPPEDLLFKEHFIAENLTQIRALAKKIKDITAIIGFVDRGTDKRVFNAAAVIADQRLVDVYHKQALPNYGVFDEKRYFSSGQVNRLYLIGKNSLGLSVCEDIWVPQGPCCEQVKAGAQVLINLSSSPYHVGKGKQRERVLKQWARRYHAFVCYANLVGGQDELVFDGGSAVVSPKGRLIASGKQFEEDLVLCDLDVKNPRRQIKKNNLKRITIAKAEKKGPRPVLVKKTEKKLDPLEEIYRALVLGTRDYVEKNGFKKVVFGLSGGIDSALVATIAVDAVGKDNVVGVTMPSQYSSKETKGDAHKLAESLGIRLIEIPIQGVFGMYQFLLRNEFLEKTFDVAEENLQARIRGNLLMAFSNKFGWLVLATGNKSEIAVGYCTLYGDMSGGFAVIKDVPKTTVYELADFVNRKKEKVIPKSIIERAPSAELKENQKDQDSLPAYNILDAILKAYVEEHKTLAQINRNINNAELVKQVINMVNRSEYKRRQAPPGVKISPRAFGKDWRLPMTNKYKEF